MCKFDLLIIHFKSWVKVSYTHIGHLLYPQQYCLREADFESISSISAKYSPPGVCPYSSHLPAYAIAAQFTNNYMPLDNIQTWCVNKNTPFEGHLKGLICLLLFKYDT